MNRQQKEAVVADFKKMFTSSQATFLVRYQGLTVADMLSLRRALRESGGRLKITKARLMKLAAQGIEGIEPFKDNFKDQIGLVFALDQAPSVAKQLYRFAKEHEALQILSGFFESKCLAKEEVEFLASIPSREVLLAQLASVLQAPVAGLASVMQALILQLLYALKAVAAEKSRV